MNSSGGWCWWSYLTSLCNTSSTHTYSIMVSPSPSPALFSSYCHSFRSHSPIPAPSLFVLSLYPLLISAGLSCGRLTASPLVIPGPRSHWLFLRLPKLMPGRDWWVCVGSDHAGTVSMCSRENMWLTEARLGGQTSKAAGSSRSSAQRNKIHQDCFMSCA